MPVPATDTDLYGTDIALGAGGDLVVWANGALGNVSGPENCVQALTLRMRTRRGELPLHGDFGSGLPDQIGSKLDGSLAKSRANIELRRILEGDPRFIAAKDISVDEVAPGKLQIRTTLHLAGGEQLKIASLEQPVVSDISDPAQLDSLSLDQLDLVTDAAFFGDPLEVDTLSNLNELAEMASDNAATPIEDIGL